MPAENARDVKPGANVSVSFSEEMKATTVGARTVKLCKKGARTAVPAAVRDDAAAKKAVLDPSAPLERGATCKETVATGVRDLAGNPLAQAKTWTCPVRT